MWVMQMLVVAVESGPTGRESGLPRGRAVPHSPGPMPRNSPLSPRLPPAARASWARFAALLMGLWLAGALAQPQATADGVAVATGSYTVEQLRETGAAIVFQDLSDTQAFLELLV